MGEVAAEILTDFPELFAARRRLFLLEQNGSRRELHLESFWPHKHRLVMKFEAIDSISDAESLVGGEVQIPSDERAPLEEGSVYVSDLIGCAVWISGPGRRDSAQEIGAVADVTFGAGEAPILTVKQGPRELLIPFAQAFIKVVDTAAKRVELELPEGMLELDAPLSDEEKDAQKGSK